MRCSRARAFRWCALAVGVLVATFAAWMVFRPGGERLTKWVDDIGELVAAVIAGVVCLVAARRHPIGRRTWRFLGLSALAWASGQAVWSWYELLRGVPSPFPSLADAGFLAAVPLAAVAVLVFPGAPKRQLSRLVPVLDGLALAGSLLVVSWGTVLGAVYRGGGNGLLKDALSLAYPVGDIVIATIVLMALARGSSARSATLGLLAFGLGGLAFSDSAFAYFSQLSPNAYIDWIDTGWVAGYLVIALAALDRGSEGRRPTEAREGQLATWHVLVPCGAVLVAMGVLVDKALAGRLDTLLIVAGGLTVAVVVVRQALTLAHNLGLTGDLEDTIDELHDRERRLVHEALHDPLTGLANRVLFADRLSHALASDRSGEHAVAVVFCDLDDFKAVNDSAGHAAGDELLHLVAERLTGCVRAGDTVARLGGDEFALVLERGDEARVVADRITRVLTKPFRVAERDLFIRASIGIATADDPAIDAEALVRNADFAMYQAKAAPGRGPVVYSGPVVYDSGSRLELESDLHRALERNELRVFFQPIVRLDTRALTGFEALVRWQHPKRGLLEPADFIEIAESSGLIVPIGEWVLEEACRLVQDCQPADGSRLGVSVNVSPRQLRSPDFAKVVARVVALSGIDPGDLCLEITEGTLVDESITSSDVLERIRALGVHLAIDDFGIGYATLGYLRRLPADVLKIDRSFVADLSTDPGVRAIVGAIIHLATSMGLTIVAEGVETPAQCSALRSLGGELAQGFYFARPADAHEWTGSLQHH